MNDLCRKMFRGMPVTVIARNDSKDKRESILKPSFLEVVQKSSSTGSVMYILWGNLVRLWLCGWMISNRVDFLLLLLLLNTVLFSELLPPSFNEVSGLMNVWLAVFPLFPFFEWVYPPYSLIMIHFADINSLRCVKRWGRGQENTISLPLRCAVLILLPSFSSLFFWAYQLVYPLSLKRSRGHCKRPFLSLTRYDERGEKLPLLMDGIRKNRGRNCILITVFCRIVCIVYQRK